jgi:mono/diheme cytochrome c family protein
VDAGSTRGGRARLLGFSVTVFLIAVLGPLAWPTRATAPAAAPADLDLQAGQALYATYCALCHGPSGQGDGPSAGGFATKPSNLADGRLMNGLPDDFLVKVITHGGLAEGLSPGMPAFGVHLSDAQIRQVILYVRSLASPPFRGAAVVPTATPPRAPTQPIFFSHLIHAGKYQIDCQYCHADARRSEYAGLPSVERCLGCHKIIGAQDNPEIGKIMEYARRGQPIPWVRIFKLPEFTYFTHKAHVRFGLACQACHGPIERMRVVGADTGPSLANDLMNLIGLKPPPRPLTMGWCVECHREQNAARGARAPLDCVTCHH